MKKKDVQINGRGNRYQYLHWLFPLMFFAVGCQKYLDQKSQKNLAVPTTLQELQRLLDNAEFNVNAYSSAGLSEFVADNFYVTTTDWQSWATILPPETNTYIWSTNDPPPDICYYGPYQRPIYYANIVLDQLPRVNHEGEKEMYNTLRGSALFYRSFAFWGIAQLFCKPYAAANVNELGIVLKMTSSITERVGRATVQQTYARIIADLKEAANLLPLTTIFPTRPSKTAAYAALARVYLSMGDYNNAAIFANYALQQYNTLINYNTRVPVGNPPMSTFNEEVIFHNYSGSTTPALLSVFYKVDSTLYRTYEEQDLRKTVFFEENTGANTNTYSFRGSYHGTNSTRNIFDGLTTAELYLVRAECAARAGNKDLALADLNMIMANRWEAGYFNNITAIDAAEALQKILVERRKELVFRGLRWSDIRRLNIEGANITLKRVVAGITYFLQPNDPKSVLLFPLNEINLAGIQQNLR